MNLPSKFTFSGTMSIHQVCWYAEDKNILQFNELSCFDPACINARRCSHFFITEQTYEEDNGKLKKYVYCNENSILKLVKLILKFIDFS